MTLPIGSTWRLYDIDAQDVVTVLVVETNHVLVEHRDKKYAYGGPSREWWPRAWFTMGNRILRREN